MVDYWIILDCFSCIIGLLTEDFRKLRKQGLHTSYFLSNNQINQIKVDGMDGAETYVDNFSQKSEGKRTIRR
jgi:hypothetical protein